MNENEITAMPIPAIDVENIAQQIESGRERLNYNNEIYEMMEGNLLKFVRRSLNEQLSNSRSVKTCMERAIPINVWKKVVDKISTLYINEPLRTTQNPVNQGLIDYYVKNGVNAALAKLNAFTNAYRWAAMEITKEYDEMTGNAKLNFSTLLPVSFIPIIDPANRTRVVGFAFPFVEGGVAKARYYANGDFFILNLKEKTVEFFDASDFFFTPFIYSSDSDVDALPNINRATMKMPILISILLSDINYGMMFNFHPIIYGVDVNEMEFERAPEVWLDLKSSLTADGKAQIGVLNTTPDVANYVQLVRDEMALWLDSEGLKSTAAAANSNGAFTASGISKIIDNADVSEKRKKQEVNFAHLEQTLWKKIAYMHNAMVANGELKMEKFVDPDNLEIAIDFNADSLLSNDASHVQTVINKFNAGLISRQQAIKEINPTWSDEKIKLLIADIDALKNENENKQE